MTFIFNPKMIQSIVILLSIKGYDDSVRIMHCFSDEWDLVLKLIASSHHGCSLKKLSVQSWQRKNITFTVCKCYF